MNTAEVIAICQQLASEGKEPSVALIKSRLTQSMPLPLVIAGLKSFKANPQQEQAETGQVVNEETDTLTLDQRVSALEAEVSELKALIKSLTNQYRLGC